MLPIKPIQLVINEATSIAKLMWQYGWAEASAGNFSINISDQEHSYDFNKNVVSEVNLRQEYPLLNDQYILITVSGSRMRDISISPTNSLIIIKVIDNGKKYQIIPISEGYNNQLPTSELQTHLELHSFFIENSLRYKSIIHSHLTELITLSHFSFITNSESLNSILQEMHPEFSLFIPEGIGYIDFIASGNEKIAKETVKQISNHQLVVWEKHGCISIGKSLSEAFDLQEIVAKSCQIYLQCQNVGFTSNKGKRVI